jgi:hypothetical protein
MGYYHFIQMMRTTTWLGFPPAHGSLGWTSTSPRWELTSIPNLPKKWWLDEAQKWGDHADMNQLK